MKLENLLCTVCGERTVTFEDGKSVCGTCEHEIEDAVICDECGNAVSESVFDDFDCCPFCGCDSHSGEKVTYCDCSKCSNEYIQEEDYNGTGMCEDCREAYENFGDDELLDEICKEFNVYPYEVEFDREYMQMTIGLITYDVFDDDSIVDEVGKYIKETLWAFSSWFLANETGIDEEIFITLANSGKCESLNDGLLDIIEKTCGIQDFIDSAICTDGLSHYIEDDYVAVGDYYLR